MLQFSSSVNTPQIIDLRSLSKKDGLVGWMVGIAIYVYCSLKVNIPSLADGASFAYTCYLTEFLLSD